MQSSISRRPRAVALVLSVGLVIATFTRWSSAQPAPRLKEPVPPIAPIEAGVAVLIVDPPSGGNVMDSDALLQRRINTHAATIGSEQHLRKVIAQPEGETRKTRWFKESDNPLERAEWLRDHLHVTVLPGTSLIQVSLPDLADAGERKTVVQAICQTYLESQRSQHSDELLDRTMTLNNTRIKIEASLKILRADMREKAVQLNLDGVAVGGAHNGLGIKEIELSRLVQEQVEAQLALGKASAHSQQEATTAEARLKDLNARVDNLKQDMGELSNSMIRYTTLQREEQGLTEQLRQVKQQIDSIMAMQSSKSLGEIRWHLYPEVTPVR
jgi:hypothetical protein